MKKADLLLTLVACTVALPVLIPIAFLLHVRDQRHMQAAAGNTHCEGCGSILGAASLQRADAAWGQHVTALFRDQPGVRFRLMRRLKAMCAVCGAEYDFDTTLGAFFRLTQPLGFR